MGVFTNNQTMKKTQQKHQLRFNSSKIKIKCKSKIKSLQCGGRNTRLMYCQTQFANIYLFFFFKVYKILQQSNQVTCLTVKCPLFGDVMYQLRRPSKRDTWVHIQLKTQYFSLSANIFYQYFCSFQHDHRFYFRVLISNQIHHHSSEIPVSNY